jgi:hypothetical protein
VTRTVSTSALEVRPLSARETDKSALQALAQAAVNVELFTIPLYMAAMYSVQGTHPITGDNNFYEGRLWPGAAPSADPATANEQAFNIIFSVFIEEMLHLQLAANLASALGVQPIFTSSVLQDESHGWTCYGPDNTVIPHIVDMRDTVDDSVRVNLGGLTPDQLRLFMIIEEPEDDARKRIRDWKKYFPSVPFANWRQGDNETDLPMFGTIGHMYQCLLDYMSLRYPAPDGGTTTLFEYAFDPSAPQNDIFDGLSAGHPQAEYPGFGVKVTAKDAPTAFQQVTNMMDAITDQGEGSVLKPGAGLQVVQGKYRSSEDALTADYPDYTDAGQPGPVPPSDCVARAGNDEADHYARFGELAQNLVSKVETWPAWWGRVGKWTAQDLQPGLGHDPRGTVPPDPYGLPPAEAVAGALNRMRTSEEEHDLVDRVAAGAIAGVTTVLNSYWSGKSDYFPFPSMAGAGDRMAICWAIYGVPPDLSKGIGEKTRGVLYHTCQGLDLAGDGTNNCAAEVVFHTCKGSNLCKAEGGCGFINTTSGPSVCSHTAFTARLSDVAVAADLSQPLYSSPSDNKCAGFGGCASPISASQILAAASTAEGKEIDGGTLAIYDFEGQDNEPVQIAELNWAKGDKVHDLAYQVYQHVMEHRGKKVPEQAPADNDRRLAFPPST